MRQLSKKTIKERMRIKKKKAILIKEYNKGMMTAWKGFFMRIDREEKRREKISDATE